MSNCTVYLLHCPPVVTAPVSNARTAWAAILGLSPLAQAVKPNFLSPFPPTCFAPIAASEKVELGVVGVALVVLGELRELRDLR
ncbi:hypothetical protein BKA82DRAFT_24161 [Pisolithus tinctorius]|uniref:Uncharacterized protein n=1 Tax=Pisolithus tinctorius Marx 270 TaxID=870435 RepID=A0A0C3JD90_PISTI|nr:hypothetical protein BKA82DRAFT_24161 [Pisolithus tinctorius]KIO07048.1 hypothetical protein M404DRAFT_24161 [Pisolithus tinctorius Marx 270]